MSIHVGESGKLYGYNTNLDLSSNTSLSLVFTAPDGSKITIDPSRISAPAVDGIFDVNGTPTTFLANQYMQFITLSTDFLTSGGWYVCGTYTNAGVSPEQIFSARRKSFTVDKAC